MSSRVSREFRFCRFEFTISLWLSRMMYNCSSRNLMYICVCVRVRRFLLAVGNDKVERCCLFYRFEIEKNLVDPYIIYIWFSTILHLVTSLFFFLYFPIFSIQRFENREIFFFSKFISKNEVSRKSSGERNLPGSESFFINSTSRGSRRVFHN